MFAAICYAFLQSSNNNTAAGNVGGRMYNQFYGFRESPFSLLPDPDFLYLSSEHGTALNLLELAILNQSGFCVISGEVGAGKTTVVRELLNRLDEQVSVGLITNTHASFNDLMRWILAAFDLKAEKNEGVVMHRQFTEFVTGEYNSGKHTLLIIDEAQNLSIAALEQLRMLSNINSGSELLLQVVLVGQKELRENLKRPELEQFAQRISIDYFLEPLDEVETIHVDGESHTSVALLQVVFRSLYGRVPRLLPLTPASNGDSQTRRASQAPPPKARKAAAAATPALPKR